MSKPRSGLNGQVASILGGMDANHFLAHYWQKKPLLIPRALGEPPALSADELAGLALEDNIESRLVREDSATQSWNLDSGPFDEKTLQNLPDQHWTLLVQAVDQWLPEIHGLLDHFDFLPRWRLDDVMISLSADGGSVGPHFDNYDVFLLQTRGKKRWRIGQHCKADTLLVEDSPLRLLADFQPREEYLLEPGDMLYLPPKLAHWGIAEGLSMTCSIGFRAPTAVEALDEVVCEMLAAPASNDRAYTDPPLSTELAGGEISPAFINALKAMLNELLGDEQRLGQWFARHMTARKYPELELLAEDESPPDWRRALNAGDSLCWHPASRCALLPAAINSGQDCLAADGELYPGTPRLASLLCTLRRLKQTDLTQLSSEEMNTLDVLVNQGSLILDDQDSD